MDKLDENLFKCPECDSSDLSEVRVKLTDLQTYDVVDYCHNCQVIILDEHDVIGPEDIEDVTSLH